MAKKKKEKIVYIDDGRSLADLSGVQGGFTPKTRPLGRPRASIKEQLGTFFCAMRMTFLPMLAVVGGLILLYLLLWLIFWLA